MLKTGYQAMDESQDLARAAAMPDSLSIVKQKSDELRAKAAEGAAIIEQYFKQFPGIRNYMDETIKLMTARGAPQSQAAAWNTPQGKGRAVYLDTEPYGGVTLELIYDPH
jgi:hypothetical protein